MRGYHIALSNPVGYGENDGRVKAEVHCSFMHTLMPPVEIVHYPDNDVGRVVLVDFSLAKTGLNRLPGGKCFTFCGSAAYVAPEMLSRT